MFNTLDLFENYPIFNDLTMDNYADHIGDELYLIIPTDSKATIKIYDYILDLETSKEYKGDLLLEKAGSPVLVSGNISDNFSNIIIEIIDSKQNILEFQPYINLIDSKLAFTNAQENITDITPYGKLGEIKDYYYNFQIENLIGEWSSNYYFDDKLYIMNYSFSENGKINIDCGIENEPFTISYEGEYSYSLNPALPTGNVDLNLTLINNESTLDLKDNINGTYRFIELFYEAGFTVTHSQGDKIFELFEYQDFTLIEAIG